MLRIILFGASGMVGQGVLRECLIDPEVRSVLTVGRSAGPGRAVSQWIMALCLMVVGALIYQPSAMFYVVPLAAALIR